MRAKHCFCHIFILLYLISRSSFAALYYGSTRHPTFTENTVASIPSFLIIGTAKGGTTDLYEQLAALSVNADPQRPDPPILRGPSKEFNFLAKQEMSSSELSLGGTKFIEYLQKLGHPCSNVSAQSVSACLKTFGKKFVTVDATPTNLFVPRAPLHLSMVSSESKIIVMLRDPVERAEMLFRHVNVDEGKWTETSLNNVTDLFFEYLKTEPGVKANLTQLSNCQTLSCMADGWMGLSALNMHGSKEVRLFAGGLYVYSLAMWRKHYFKPGRVMVIDSHAYFNNRYSVMEQVVYFLYGRAMTPREQMQARTPSFWRKGPKALSKAGSNWVLSPLQRVRLTQFYNEHVTRQLGETLAAMRQEGAAVVGFDKEPWTSNAQFRISER